MNRKEKQFKENVEWLVCGYANGMNYSEEEYPLLTLKECADYVKAEVFDIKYDGCGGLCQGKGICKDLKFVGDEKMLEIIKEIATQEGVLVE